MIVKAIAAVAAKASVRGFARLVFQSFQLSLLPVAAASAIAAAATAAVSELNNAYLPVGAYRQFKIGFRRLNNLLVH